MKTGAAATILENFEDDEPYHVSSSFFTTSSKSRMLRTVIILSIASTLIEIFAGILLDSSIIFANVIDGTYEVVLLLINYQGMLHEENGRLKHAMRFARLTDALLIFGCLLVVSHSCYSWHNPHLVDGRIVALVSFISIIINIIATFKCPNAGFNGRSAFIKVVGGTMLVSVGFLGGIGMWIWQWQRVDSLAGAVIAVIIGAYLAWNFYGQRRR